jgi:hypothetical protein
MTFKPGQSGNPAGRPRGSRNKRTLIAEQRLDEHAGDVTQAAIDLAVGGDGPALRMCMDRIAPPMRDRLLDFALPKLETAADAVAAASAIANGAAHGELTVPEAVGLMKLVRGFIAALAAVEREGRNARAEAHDGDAAARNDHAPIIVTPCPPRDAVAATTTSTTKHPTPETTNDDHDRPIAPAPARPCERSQDRTQDRAAYAARQRRESGRLREAPRRHAGERAPDRHHRGDVAARRGQQLLGDRAAAPL